MKLPSIFFFIFHHFVKSQNVTLVTSLPTSTFAEAPSSAQATSSPAQSRATTLQTSATQPSSPFSSQTISSSPQNDTFGSNTQVVGSAPAQLYPISIQTPSGSFDFTGFPLALQLVSGNPDFMQKYDFTAVPSLAPSTPAESRRSVDCNSLNSQTCSWMCGGCTRSDDVVSCPSNLDWALSYDDGPSTNTLNLLSYLSDKRIKATFSVIGSQVVLYPNIVLAQFQAGHQIVAHTWSHRALTSLPTPVVVAELEWSLLAIQKVLGVRPLYFRPPYGDVDDRVRAIAKAMGLRPVLWNYDTRDFSAPSAQMETAAGTQASGAASRNRGVISLEHDLISTTVLFSPGIADRVAASGMDLKSVAQCIGDNYPYTSFFNSSYRPYTATSSSSTSTTSTTLVSATASPTLIRSSAAGLISPRFSTSLMIARLCFLFTLLL